MAHSLTPDQRTQLSAALTARKPEGLAALPKTDLHAHGLLSASWIDLRALSPSGTEPPRRFDGVSGFFRWLKTNVNLPRRPAEYHALMSSAFRRMAAESVRYAELTLPVEEAKALRLDAADWADLIQDAAAPFSEGLEVALGVEVSRSMPPWRAKRLASKLVKAGRFAFVDFAGHESARGLADYRVVAAVARAGGMKLKAHLGEVGTAEDVRAGVEALDLDAVQHGIAAAQSQPVMDYLRDRGVVLNLCPASNVALGVVESIPTHPIGRLLRNGVAVTLNTDDYGIFGSDLGDQMLALHGTHTLTAEELAQIIDNGLRQIPHRRTAHGYDPGTPQQTAIDREGAAGLHAGPGPGEEPL